MEQINDYIYYDTNSKADEDDEHTFQHTIQVKDVIDGTNDDDANIYGETINNNFITPVSTEDGDTGVTIEHEGILHVQYCHYGELYYQLCAIYGDDPVKTEDAIGMMAHSSKLWSLCEMLLLFKLILCLVSALKWNMTNK